jgi:hypothetical protein
LIAEVERGNKKVLEAMVTGRELAVTSCIEIAEPRDKHVAMMIRRYFNPPKAGCIADTRGETDGNSTDNFEVGEGVCC